MDIYFQVEYAQEAVKKGSTAVSLCGIFCYYRSKIRYIRMTKLILYFQITKHQLQGLGELRAQMSK